MASVWLVSMRVQDGGETLVGFVGVPFDRMVDALSAIAELQSAGLKGMRLHKRLSSFGI
jgi:hypothetical protein